MFANKLCLGKVNPHFAMRFFCTAAALLCFPFISLSQIEVATGSLPPYDPQTLIEDVLLGEGVEILNIDYEGPARAVGYFNNGSEDIGLEEGIVLTTGVSVTEGANLGITEPGSVEASANNQSTATDADIQSLAGPEDIFNLVKYTITFVPSSDRLSFRYVFASEEYPEFGCTAYNDVFGFFISGPGITGTFENGGENIALIPGTNLPVTINNIHPQNPVNPACTPEYLEFYNDNDGSNDFPVYDGYLDIFTAEAEVIPCQTYTIKLVIADISDAQRDSGVFFEAKSFNSKGFEVSANSDALDGTLVEGCTEGEFVISIEEAASENTVIDYQMVGDAENGTDYQTIGGTISIPAGQTSVTIPVIPLTDTNTEGIESVGLDVQINDCTRDTFYLYLSDPTLENPDLGEDQTLCNGESLQLDGTVNAESVEGQIFTSQPGDSPIILGPIAGNPPVPAYVDIEVSGFNPPVLREGLIDRVCINIDHSALEDLDVYLYAPNGNFMLLTSDNGGMGDDYTNTCFSPSATQPITFGMSNAPASEAPFTGTFIPEGSWENLYFGDSPVNGTWRLMAIDDEQGFTGQIMDWSIAFNSVYQVNYAWSPAAGLTCTDCPNPTVTPTSSAEYELTVTDSYGCSVSDNITLNVIDSYAAPDVNCTDVTTNSVTFTWEEVPFAESYEVSTDNVNWFVPNASPTMHTVSGLSTGETVVLMVRAVGDCPAEVGMQSCQTLDCSGLTVAVSTTPATCAGASDAFFTVSATGANGGLTYQANGETNTTGTFTGLTAGLYPVTVTDDAGCTVGANVNVNEPDAIQTDIVVNNQIDCDDATASATATGTGGSGTLSYAWSNGDITATATFDTVGEYFVTISDNNNCSVTDSVMIISEGELSADISDDIICADGTDGSATVTVSAGTEPVTYQWDAAADNQTTATADNLSPGIYSVTVTSADGCELILQTDIDSYPALSADATATNASCGGSDGSVTVNAAGGTEPLSYLWDAPGMPTTTTVDDLPAGNYNVTVTDANQCTVVASTSINTPSDITLSSLMTTDVSCFGLFDGMVDLTAQGGTAPLEYTLDGAGPQSIGQFGALYAGEYSMIVTDAAGCSVSIDFVINEPAEIQTAPVNITEISCTDAQGSATVIVTGGNAPYSFAWSNSQSDSILIADTAGAYTVTITDSEGCTATESVTVGESAELTASIDATTACAGEDSAFAFVEITTGTAPFNFLWEDGSTNDTLYNLTPATYTVTVTDANDCEEILSVTVEEFPAFSLNLTSTDADCNGAPDGTATVTVTGGTPDFIYVWSDGQMTATATELAAGLYTVTVTDANGCTQTGDATVSTPSMLSIADISAEAVTCHDGTDGTATVTAAGGTGAFNYQWDAAAANQTTATAADLAPGTYSVTVSDAENCQVTASVTVENAEEIVLSFDQINVLCAADEDGSIDLSVSGGTQPYTYSWSNGAMTEDIAELSAGIYEVTVTDSNSCTVNGQATISTTTPIEVTVLINDVTCFDYEDGSVSINVNGGVSPYTYAWSSGQTTQNLTDIVAGDYQVTVTDANGCGVFAEAQVNQPAVFGATVEVTEPLCAGDETGVLTVNVIGGQPDYLYSIDGIIYTPEPTFVNLPSQSYNITVIDGNECVYDTTDVFLPAPQELQVYAGEDQTVEIGDRAFLEAQIVGGTGAVEFMWEEATNIDLSCNDCLAPYALVNSSGTLTVTATDENGCTAADSLLLAVRKVYNLYLPNAFSPDFDGVNDRFFPMGKSNVFIESMEIYDRWGDLVYTGGEFFASDENAGWDGKTGGQPAETGVYVYYVEAIFADGESALFKGDVTLVR